MKTTTNINRLRRIAKKRIVEQFGDTLRDYGVLFVDCGAAGKVFVEHGGSWFVCTWLERPDKQVVVLAGEFGREGWR